MIKQFLLIGSMLLFSGYLYSQNGVAINTTGANAHASAMIDITSTSKGALLPRMTLTQRNSISSPATSLLIYQTDNTPGYYYYTGSNWVMLAATGNNWTITGNSGTNPSNNFIGTTDNVDFVIRTNNTQKIRILGGTNPLVSIGPNTTANAVLDINASGQDNWTTGNWKKSIEINNGHVLKWKGDGGNRFGIGQTTIGENIQGFYILSGNGDLSSSTPTYHLFVHANGAITFGGTSNSNAALEIGTSHGIKTRFVRAGYDTHEFRQSTGSGFEIWNATDSRSEMFFNGAGSIGIQCTNPQATLHVNGTIRSTFTINTASLACSDIRYKKQIINIKNAIEKIKNINGVYYYWDKEKFPDWDFSSTKQIGFIAQDLELIFPELVFTDENGFKSVEYSKLTAVIVEAIKEQQLLIETLTNQINTLQKENNLLKQNINNDYFEKINELNARLELIEKNTIQQTSLK
jgi:hypothetical protein